MLTTSRKFLRSSERATAAVLEFSAGHVMSSIVEFPMATDDDSPQEIRELLPLVYDELKRLAYLHMKSERLDHTLTPTALLHEAWLRLSDSSQPQPCTCRSHFFSAAAEAMRRILVEHARGHNRRSVILQTAVYPEIMGEQSLRKRQTDLVAVDEALSRLKEHHPEKAELVKLRYFGGLSLPAAAEVVGISLATANRHWAYARAWLSRELGERDEED